MKGISRGSLRACAFLFLSSTTCIALAQQLPSPCGAYEAPKLIPRDDIEPPVPNQPIPLSSLFTLQRPQGRQPVYTGVCMRREPVEKPFYDVLGVSWTRQPPRTFDFACVDIEGAMVKSSTTGYGVSWGSTSVVFSDKARAKYIPFTDWTVVYQWAGDDISYGAWACQEPIHADFPVGFDPSLALLSAQRLFLNRNTAVTKKEVFEASEQLRTNFAAKVIADETSAGIVVYRVGKSFDKPVKFSLQATGGTHPGTLTSFDSMMLTHGGSGGGPSVTVQPGEFEELEDALGQKSKFAFANYRAPAPGFKPGDPPSSLTLTVENGEDIRKIIVPIEAPPVVLMHGLWGSINTFSSWPMGPGGSTYPSFKFVKTQYDGSKSFRDPGNQTKMMNAIRGLQNEMTVEGVIGSRVDVVGHSMGGLMTRQFLKSDANRISRAAGGLQLFSTSPIYRFVTLDTPHKGSPMAQFLWDNRNATIVTLCPAGGVVIDAMACYSWSYSNLAAAFKHPIDSAIESMATQNFSELSLASPGEASGGYLSVAANSGARDPLKIGLDGALTALNGTTVNTLFEAAGDTSHDVIVGLNSQHAYSSVAKIALPSYPGRNHISVTNDPEVKADVMCFLGGGACTVAVDTAEKTRLALQGKTEPGPEWNLDLSTLTQSNNAGVMVVDSPLQQGMRGGLVLTVTGKAVKAAYLTFESSILDRQYFYVTQANTGYDWLRFTDLPVPQTDVMHATILILLDDNTYGIYKKDFPVVAAPVGNYTGVQLLDDFISLDEGQSQPLQLLGKGTSGSILLPVSLYSIQVLTGSDVVSITSEGVVTALKPGVAMLSIENTDLGVVLSATVRVGEPVAPVVPTPSVAVRGVEFIDSAPTVTIRTSVNVPKSATVTLSNTGTGELQVGAITWDTAPALVSITDNQCTNAKLAPSAICTFTLRYSPTAAGTSTGTLRVATNDVRYESLPIKVSAQTVTVGTASVSVSGVSCSGTVGQAATCTGTPTITATGGSVTLATTPVTLTGAQATEFAVAAGNCAGAALVADASCTLGSVTFTAGANGTRSVTLNSMVTEGTSASASLSGTGSGSTGTGGNGGNGGNGGGGGGGSLDRAGLGSLVLLFGLSALLRSRRRWEVVHLGDAARRTTRA